MIDDADQILRPMNVIQEHIQYTCMLNQHNSSRYVRHKEVRTGYHTHVTIEMKKNISTLSASVESPYM